MRARVSFLMLYDSNLYAINFWAACIVPRITVTAKASSIVAHCSSISYTMLAGRQPLA
jgi:hypothetical protein